MVDTIQIRLPWHHIGNPHYDDIFPLLVDEEPEEKKKKGLMYMKGKLENMQISLGVETGGLFIQGSLPRYWQGNNIETLCFEHTHLPIEKLQDNLHVSLENGIITRIDIAHNIPTCFDPTIYFDCFGNHTYLKRLSQPKSLRYQNGQRQYVIYDKVEESKSKKVPLPDSYQDMNLLRLEYRYMKRLQNKNGIYSNQIGVLREKDFWYAMEAEWKKIYKQIHKYPKILPTKTFVYTPKSFMQFLALIGINSMGGAKEVVELIDRTKKANRFLHDRYARRAKEKIEKILDTFNEESAYHLIHELDRKVSEVRFLT